VAHASRLVRSGEADLVVAGGVESMTRAPFVMPKAAGAWSRANEVYDTTIGWRFPNPAMEAAWGTDSMPETAENVADDYGVAREDQDAFALRSQERAASGTSRRAEEIVPVSVPPARRGGEPTIVELDEHPRRTSLEALAALKPIVRPGGTVTAGNSSGVNDGAAAMLVASGAACQRLGLEPLARIVGASSAGVAPRVMGIGPIPATRKLLGRLGVDLSDVGVIELNEAFASQALVVLRELGIKEDAEHVNPNGGAIALGHPLGMSGARLALTAAMERRRRDERYALATLCVGVGQGMALLLERP